MYINYYGMAIFLIATLVVGTVFVCSPLRVAKLLLVRFNNWDENIYPIIREARQIINENPEEYARRFRFQIITIRCMGIVSLMMFIIGLSTLIISFIN